jgi:haloacetate dehalogenase
MANLDRVLAPSGAPTTRSPHYSLQLTTADGQKPSPGFGSEAGAFLLARLAFVRSCRAREFVMLAEETWMPRTRAAHDSKTGPRPDMLLEGFTRSEIKTSGARIVTVTGGKGPPVLLMHGNPFNHLNWHKVAPTLAREFTVVATDLRGYGDSEKPPGGEDHSGYSFRAMAQDQIEVMASLGFDRFYAAGHDRGARVLHRMCLDHPEKVLRAAILDIIPQHHLYNHINQQWATFSWHWFFNIQPYDLPERMMGADPDWFIEKKLAKTRQGLSFFDPEALAEYKRCFRNPATIHAICEDYRAAAGIDLEMDAKDFEAGRKITCPVLYGARPAAWADTAGPAQPKYGRPTPPTSSMRKLCLPAIIYPTKRRPKPPPPCAGFSPRSYRPGRTDPGMSRQIAVGAGMSRKLRTACQNR